MNIKDWFKKVFGKKISSDRPIVNNPNIPRGINPSTINNINNTTHTANSSTNNTANTYNQVLNNKKSDTRTKVDDPTEGNNASNRKSSFIRKEEKVETSILKKEEKIADKELKSLRNSGRVIGGHGEEEEKRAFNAENMRINILLWVVIFVSTFDFLTGSQRHSRFLIIMDILIIFYIVFALKDSHSGSDISGLIIFMALAYLLPYGVEYLRSHNYSELSLAFAGMLFWCPILLMYIVFKYQEFPATKWARGLMVIIICCLLINVAVSSVPTQQAKVMITQQGSGVGYILKKVSSTPGLILGNVQESINKAIAQATGQPYDGSEESRVGVYIEKIKPLESRYYASSEDVIVTAKISAVNVKEPLNINVHCRIDGVREGTAIPDVLTEVVGNYENIIECRFGKLKTGTYTTKIIADFKFESTSDITYTFVSKELRPDQYSDLNIDERVVATYTGGPVELGLPSLTQPLRIETDPKFKQSSYPFGISLNNKWSQGKIVRGVNYTLDTPKEVLLENCSRKPIRIYEPAAGTERNKYEFEMDTNKTQESFGAIRCQMQFEKIDSLLGIDLKSEKTFAGIANYEYQVEGSTTLIVEKN